MPPKKLTFDLINIFQKFKKSHRGMSKIIQSIPNNTSNASHLALVGWHTLDTKISIMKLCFLWRILCLPIGNIYRRILTFCLQLCINVDSYINVKSPSYSMFTLKRYSLTFDESS